MVSGRRRERAKQQHRGVGGGRETEGAEWVGLAEEEEAEATTWRCGEMKRGREGLGFGAGGGGGGGGGRKLQKEQFEKILVGIRFDVVG